MLTFVLAGLLLADRQPVPAPTPDPCGGPSRLLATLNRPTVGYSPCAGAPHTTVFEEGYQYQRGNQQTLIQYPQSFIRYGISPRFELDLIGPAYNHVLASNGISQHGYSDSGAGFKIELPPSARWTLGFDGLYTSPNGSPSFTAGTATLTANADAAYAVTPTFSVGTTQSFGSELWMPSFVLTKQLGAVNQIYAEYVYQSKAAANEGGRAYVDYGLQHLIGPRIEVDAEIGHAFSADRRLRFNYVGVGLGFEIGETP
jgi:hypothetical protein